MAENRRSFVRKAGVVTATGMLAGCLGGGEEGENAADTTPTEDTGETGGEGNGSSNGEAWPKDGDEFEMVIPHSPGGGYDTYSRLLTPYLEKHLPADVEYVARNVEGAGGRVGWREVSNAEPNGYTQGIMHIANASRVQLLEDVDFDLRELTWFPMVAVSYHAWGVRKGFVDDFDEFANEIQAGNVRFGTTGPGSTAAFAPAVTGALSGLWDPEQVTENWVAYDGTAPATEALLTGDIDAVSQTDANWPGYLQEDLEVIAYMITDKGAEEYEVIPELEDVPNMDDLGIPSAEEIAALYPSRRPFAGPSDIPSEKAEIIRQAYTDAIKDEEFRAEADEAGRPVTYESAEGVEQIVNTLIEQGEANMDLLELMFS